MADPDGMGAVVPEAERARYLPAQQQRDDARHDELRQSAEIPAQYVDVAVGTILREPQHVMAERLAATVLIRGQRDARVEIPADQQDAFLRALHQPGEQRIIIGGVDDHPRLARAFDPPAIASRLDDGGKVRSDEHTSELQSLMR